MLNNGMQLDIIIIDQLVGIARRLNEADNVERQLKAQIVAIAMMLVRDKDKFNNSMAWIRDIVDRVLKYLIEIGYVKPK